jgi:hypothetical protein
MRFYTTFEPPTLQRRADTLNLVTYLGPPSMADGSVKTALVDDGKYAEETRLFVQVALDSDNREDFHHNLGAYANGHKSLQRAAFYRRAPGISDIA